MAMRMQSSSIIEVIARIDSLCDCATGREAKESTAKIVRALGAQAFVYASFLPACNEYSIQSRHYLIGCRTEWCAIYTERYWAMNDPFLEYARTHSTPVLRSQIKLRTAGQVAMLQMSEEYGFRSGLVIPTHTSMSATKRMGLLYIGSDLPEMVGEQLLLKSKILFCSLGQALLFWSTEKLKQQAIRKYSLEEEELEMLQLFREGKRAAEIAAHLDIKVSAAYKKLSVVSEKFNVTKFDRAVAVAESAGLLS
jgi:DNA-binding CsgD family transcriptional regulator